MAQDEPSRTTARASSSCPGDDRSGDRLGAAQCDAGQLDEASSTPGGCANATEGSHPDNARFANYGVALEGAGRDEERPAYDQGGARLRRRDAQADDDELAAESPPMRLRWSGSSTPSS
jgi:hypothetical protein